jgi:hypothetical protein
MTSPNHPIDDLLFPICHLCVSCAYCLILQPVIAMLTYVIYIYVPQWLITLLHAIHLDDQSLDKSTPIITSSICLFGCLLGYLMYINKSPFIPG